MFLMFLITPVAVTSIGYRIYLIFIVVTTFSIAFPYFTHPETNGCTLKDKDRYFELTRSWNVSNSYKIWEVLNRLDPPGDESVDKVNWTEQEGHRTP